MTPQEREAMQMALDALIDAADSQSWEMQQNIEQHGEWYRRSVYLKQATAKSQEAIEALRAALANEFNPDWDAMAVMVEEQQRMAKRIEELESALAQPEREWQGLTDEDYEAMAEKYVTNCYFDTLKYARAIEAKLKERNA